VSLHLDLDGKVNGIYSDDSA